jgi:hypothetical protein
MDGSNKKAYLHKMLLLSSLRESYGICPPIFIALFESFPNPQGF